MISINLFVALKRTYPSHHVFFSPTRPDWLGMCKCSEIVRRRCYCMWLFPTFSYLCSALMWGWDHVPHHLLLFVIQIQFELPSGLQKNLLNFILFTFSCHYGFRQNSSICWIANTWELGRKHCVWQLNGDISSLSLSHISHKDLKEHTNKSVKISVRLVGVRHYVEKLVSASFTILFDRCE